MWTAIWITFGILAAAAIFALFAVLYIAKRADEETREIYNRSYSEREKVTKPKPQDDV